jgi:formate/nitrite transporter FocA (FNT family)
MAFVAIGYEHCIANMYFCTLGLMLGADKTFFGDFVWKNLIPVTLGNIFGGAILVKYLRKKYILIRGILTILTICDSDCDEFGFQFIF